MVLATQEAEEGESLEPGRWRLQGAEMVPLHSSLGDRVKLHQKRKKEKEEEKEKRGPTCLYLKTMCLSIENSRESAWHGDSHL